MGFVALQTLSHEWADVRTVPSCRLTICPLEWWAGADRRHDAGADRLDQDAATGRL